MGFQFEKKYVVPCIKLLLFICDRASLITITDLSPSLLLLSQSFLNRHFFRTGFPNVELLNGLATL